MFTIKSKIKNLIIFIIKYDYFMSLILLQNIIKYLFIIVVKLLISKNIEFKCKNNRFYD